MKQWREKQTKKPLNVIIEYEGFVITDGYGLTKTDDEHPTFYMVINPYNRQMRNVIPCFDEPFFKSIFDIQAIHPNDYKALSVSNDEVSITITNKDNLGKTTTKFSRTPKLSVSSITILFMPKNIMGTTYSLMKEPSLVVYETSPIGFKMEEKTIANAQKILEKLPKLNIKVVMLKGYTGLALSYFEFIIMEIDVSQLPDHQINLITLFGLYLETYFEHMVNDGTPTNRFSRDIIEFIKYLLEEEMMTDDRRDLRLLKMRHSHFNYAQKCSSMKLLRNSSFEHDKPHAILTLAAHMTVIGEKIFYNSLNDFLKRNIHGRAGVEEYQKLLHEINPMYAEFFRNFYREHMINLITIYPINNSKRFRLMTRRFCVDNHFSDIRYAVPIMNGEKITWIVGISDVDKDPTYDKIWTAKPSIRMFQLIEYPQIDLKELPNLIKLTTNDPKLISLILNDFLQFARKQPSTRTIENLYFLLKEFIGQNEEISILEIIEILEYLSKVTNGLPNYSDYLKSLSHRYVSKKFMDTLSNNNEKDEVFKRIIIFYFFYPHIIDFSQLSHEQAGNLEEKLFLNLQAIDHADLYTKLEHMSYLKVWCDTNTIRDNGIEQNLALLVETELQKPYSHLFVCTKNKEYYKKYLNHALHIIQKDDSKAQLIHILSLNSFNQDTFSTFLIENYHGLRRIMLNKDLIKNLIRLYCTSAALMDIVSSYNLLIKMKNLTGLECIDFYIDEQSVNQRLRRLLLNDTSAMLILRQIQL